MKKTAVILLSVLALVGCGKEQAPQAQTPTPTQNEPSLYAKVASIDAGTKLTEDNPQTVRVKQSIQQAATLCKLPEQEIAGKAVKVKSILEERKVAVQSVELLEMLPTLYQEKLSSDCAQILVHYISVRQTGMSHADSVKGLGGLIKAVQ